MTDGGDRLLAAGAVRPLLEHEHLDDPPPCCACGQPIEGYYPHVWAGSTRLYFHPTRWCFRHKALWRACHDRAYELGVWPWQPQGRLPLAARATATQTGRRE